MRLLNDAEDSESESDDSNTDVTALVIGTAQPMDFHFTTTEQDHDLGADLVC